MDTCEASVKVSSAGISLLPVANNCRIRSRVLYNLSRISPNNTLKGSLGGMCFQNSDYIQHDTPISMECACQDATETRPKDCLYTRTERCQEQCQSNHFRR